MEPHAEIELILACARGEPLRNLVLQGIDWDIFCTTAASHGLLPMMYWRLNADCPDAVPPEVLVRLRNNFRETAARNLLLVSELLRLLELLRHQQISAIPLKGPVLAFSMYDNFALRDFEDLDILVRRAQARQVMDLLVSNGYIPALKLSGTAEAAFVKTNYEMHFDRPGSPCPIEIHWGVQEEKFFSATLGPERWWDRLESTEIAGSRVPVASRADMLLFLCAHGAKHRWERLKWICDIAAVIRSTPELDWAGLCREAGAMGVERLLLLGLLLANRLLKCPLPEEITRQAVAEPGVELLAARVRERLYRGREVAGLFETAMFHVRLRKRLRDKLRYFSMNLFVPTAGEWKMVSLPGSLSGLYYPLRPVRLLKDALSGKR